MWRKDEEAGATFRYHNGPTGGSTSNGQRMPQSDHKLIEAFQKGDEFAFVALYNRYKGPVYAFCAKMLLDRSATHDVMQETFVRVYENRQRLLKAGSFKS